MASLSSPPPPPAVTQVRADLLAPQRIYSIFDKGASLKRRLGKPQFRDTPPRTRITRTTTRRSSTSAKDEKRLLTQVDRKLDDIIAEWSKIRNDYGLY